MTVDAPMRVAADATPKKVLDGTNAIEIDGLVKEFGRLRAVDKVTFSVPKGAVYGLIGPNGAGKTTTFSILAGYLRPTEGRATILGHDPQDVAKLKGRLGVLPQDALLPALEKVGEFLVYLARLQGIPGGEAKDAARKSLESVGGGEWWNLRCGKLSHGMAKRVGLAQALLGTPDVVLLDEPTAGLDPKVAYATRQLIKTLGEKHTVVVSSHNLVELEEVCDGAAILDRGRLVISGTMAELTRAAGEVHIQLSPGPLPLDAVRALACVATLNFDADKGALVVMFESNRFDAETVIGAVLRVLLDGGARISGVSKGRSLEQRVIELT